MINWGDHFLTGIHEVDGQHRMLVLLVNELEASIAAAKGFQLVEEAFRSLAAYARVHFTLEEQLMDEAGVNADHVTSHRSDHAHFIDDLMRMRRGEDSFEDRSKRLHEFVTEWIHHHILIKDRAMARAYFAAMRLPMPSPLA